MDEALRPLRPELYRRLKDKFRHIVVANPGQEMLLRYEGGELKILEPGEIYRVNCPYCPDTRKRLYINHRWGTVDEISGGRILWLMHCFNQSCFKSYPERRLALYNEIFDPLSSSPDAIDDVLSGSMEYDFSQPAFMPGEITPIDQLPRSHPAALYLLQRGFDLQQLSDYFKVGYCREALQNVQMANDRIFIPVYKDGAMVGWQARIIGEPSNKFVPKYYSMPGWKKGLFVYSHDLARRFNHVVICEGPTDVWRYGPEAVCLFGKMPTIGQATVLANDWATQFIMLDSDVAEDELQAVQNRLDSASFRTPIKRIVVRLPPGQDPGSMNPVYMRSLVQVAGSREGLTLTTR